MARYPILAHFPWRKSAKGVPKRWKFYFHQMYFSEPRMIWYHKGSPPVLFWDEKGPWLGRGGLYCGIQCQNLNWISVPTTGLVLLAPNFVNHLVISFKHDLHQNSHITGHLLSWPPVVLYAYFVFNTYFTVFNVSNDRMTHPCFYFIITVWRCFDPRPNEF